MRAMLVLLCATALAACAKEPEPEAVPVAASPVPLSVPAECDPAHDRDWQHVPDSDVRRSVAARNYDRNLEAFTAMRDHRRICHAGLVPHQLAPRPAKE